MQLLHNWLDAVTVNPGQFCVPCMVRASIAGSLQPPREAEGPAAMLSVNSLAIPMWIDYALSRSLQRDNILASLKTAYMEEFVRLEDRQLAAFICDKVDPPDCGYPALHANAAIWPLRPPKLGPAIARFSMPSFLDKLKFPPQVEPYHPVEIPTSKKLPPAYVQVPLETTTEVEEAIKDNNPSSSPSKVLLQQRMVSEQRKRKATDEAQPLDSSLPPTLLLGRDARHLMVTPTTEGQSSSCPLPPLHGETLPITNTASFGWHPRKYHQEQSQDGHLSGGAQGTASFGVHGSTGMSDVPLKSTQFGSSRAPPAPAPAPPLLAAGCQGPSMAYDLCLDPLARHLHLFNSAPRHDWPQAIPLAATPVAPAHPGFALPFAGPPQYDRNALSHVPFITPYQVQVVDEYGRSLRAKMENLYSENATCTWQLDAQQRYAPSNYIFFAQYLAYNAPLISGVFSVNNQPIPPSWTLYPVEISRPFRDIILRSKATGASAKLYLEGVVQTQSFLLAGSLQQPTATLGHTFFEATVFDKFCKAETWLTTKLKSADQIEMTFTALDYYRLVPGATGSRFPSEGLSREEVKTWLSNTHFLLAITSQQDYAVAGPAFPGMLTDPLFFAGIDWLLKTLDDLTIKSEWPLRSIPFTALVYDLFEDLHLILVKRIMAFQSSHVALADITLNATTTMPAMSVLMLNPESSQQYMAETLNDQFREWRDNNLIWLQKELKHRKDDLMQRHGDLHSFMFLSTGLAPLGAPNYASGLPSWMPQQHQPTQAFRQYMPAGYDQQHHPPLHPAGQSDKKSKKGEKNKKSNTNPPAIPPAYKTARKPLLQWASPQVACHPGMLMHKLRESFHVLIPPLLPSPCPSANGRDSKIFCFPYITEPISGSEFCGCNGYIPPKGKACFNLKQKCDQIHGDLSKNEFSKQDLQSLWDFIQKPEVTAYYIQTESFAAHISEISRVQD